MLNDHQHTITKSVTLLGIGLHTGIATNVTLMPADSDHGIKFQRTDLPGRPIIDADCDQVVDVSRGTTIEQSGARVATVEHILAALAGLEIDNAIIQLDGPEVPIMDGSAIQFVNMVKEAQRKKQKAYRKFYSVTESIEYKEPSNKVEITALPLNDYKITVMVDYDSNVLERQYASMVNIKDFEKEIASSRTFCFLHELEELYKNNLIKGGSLDNAIVIADKAVKPDALNSISQIFNKSDITIKENGILNDIKFYHKNEPARHKLLDVLGDLVLVGKPLKTQILANKPGHAANVALARKLKAAMRRLSKKSVPDYDPETPALLDANQLLRMLPHRYPFLLIDKVTYLDDKKIIGVKNVTINEAFFQGHFPENMVMPGVLQIEALAQIGAIFSRNMVPDPENYWIYFLGIESFRFKKLVMPGDTLVLQSELISPFKRGITKMSGRAFIGKTLVCEGTIIAAMVKKNTHE